jgi:hypothetical protein
VSIFENGWHWSVVLLGFALLTGRADDASLVWTPDGFRRPLAFAQAASDTTDASQAQLPRRETKEERRTKSKARLLAGGAMAVISLLALAMALALVRALKR